ncbi:MAG TPA: 7-cyano-7-deazaguanine synthase [Bacillota bacterium]|nr:7-cyano-7-deazaguanine synthase [Bacillota bacterium]
MKALALFSGGLDSILAVKVVENAGATVEAVHFINPFHQNQNHTIISDTAARLGIKLHFIELTGEYLELIAHPEHGYGKRMNPCIDCRIYQLKLARQLMEKIGAAFLVTGEVLDQRPNSQRRDAMDIVERDAGVRGLLLRPLTAQHLRPTLPEIENWVDRKKLLDIKGRGRTQQIELAAKYGITDYPAPAGGCLLTNEEYSLKIRDLFRYHRQIDSRNIELLRWGRHLRLAPEAKIIVGKNEAENEKLAALAAVDDYTLQVRDYAGPLTLYTGTDEPQLLELAAAITAGYTKAPVDQPVVVTLSRSGDEKNLTVNALDRETIRQYFVYKV